MAEYYGNICTCRKCNGIVHTIRRGDTLYLLSRYYNVTINEIMRANANVNVYNLQIGDQICIPVRRPAPNTPARPGQGQSQNQNQNQNQNSMQQQMQGRPQGTSMMQPRGNENNNMNNDIDDLIEDLLDANENRERMRSENMMESNAETEAMQANTSAM